MYVNFIKIIWAMTSLWRHYKFYCTDKLRFWYKHLTTQNTSNNQSAKWPWQKLKVTGEGQMSHEINKWLYLVKYQTHRHHTWYQGTIQLVTFNSGFLNLMKGQGHTSRSKTWKCLRSVNASCSRYCVLFAKGILNLLYIPNDFFFSFLFQFMWNHLFNTNLLIRKCLVAIKLKKKKRNKKHSQNTDTSTSVTLNL